MSEVTCPHCGEALDEWDLQEGGYLNARVVNERAMRITMENLRRLDTEMHSGLAASKGAGVNAEHVKLNATLNRAWAALQGEIRKYQQAEADRVGDLSLDEKKELVRSMIRRLPGVHRPDVLSRLLEDAQKDGVHLLEEAEVIPDHE